MILAMVFMSLQSNFTPPGKYNLDKILHFLAYAAASVMPVLLFKYRAKIIATEIVIIIIAAATEISQHYISGRTASYGDFAANMAGVFAGIAVGFVILRIFTKR